MTLLLAGISAEDAARNLSEAMTGRPRRRVEEHPEGWEVTPDGFTTTDQALAKAVADELDQVDPLPRRSPCPPPPTSSSKQPTSAPNSTTPAVSTPVGNGRS